MEFAQKENRFAESRMTLLQWSVAGIFLFFLVVFWRMQVLQSDYYSELADRNHIKTLPIHAPRGRILDRSGKVIAENIPTFSIIAQWSDREQVIEKSSELANGLGLNADDLIGLIKVSEKRAPYAPIVLREIADWKQVAFVESHRSEFPELDIVVAQSRVYPANGFASHMLGYVAQVSEKELENPKMKMLNPGDKIGKSGIERQYNAILQGVDGARRVAVNSRGVEVAVLDEISPIPGTDLRLTIDYDLQEVAETAFQAKVGAVVALDPRTGEVLALVSRPSFDPNAFIGGISQQAWNDLSAGPGNALLNRAIQAQLAPGSVYKILMAATALESGVIDESTTFYCPGSASFYGRSFQCWLRGGHGHVNVHQAIVNSCNVFFYNVGKNLGIDKMAEYSSRMGLGQETGIDLPNESTGIMPSPGWKERVFHEKWYPGETISVAIGQGALTVTPLQLAFSIGGIASGGLFPRPHLVADQIAPPGIRMARQTTPQPSLQDSTVAIVTNALYGVVNEGGTGGRARVPGLDIGGKTGSAQVVSNETARANQGSDDLRDTAWFVGVAPRRNPEIAVTVLYQGGEHGALAAPLAKEIIKAYFSKKAGSLPQIARKSDDSSEQIVARPALQGG